MQNDFHLIVWIDHRSAQVYAYTREGLSETAAFKAPGGEGHVHHRAGTFGGGHVPIDAHFLGEVARAVADAQEILIVGPAQARTELDHYIKRHLPAAAARIVGVEPLERTGAGDLHAFAKPFFARADRMRPQ